MEPYDDTLWVIAIMAVCLLHGWFSAVMSAVHALGGQLGTMAEEQPKLEYYVTHKFRLRLIWGMESLAFGIFLVACCCCCAWTKGSMVWNLLLLLGLGAMLLAILTDGMARGLGRRHPEIAVRFVWYIRLITVICLPLYSIYTCVEWLCGGKRGQSETVTEADIMQLVDAGNETGVIEEQQREMISNIFEFDDMPVSDVMTHRTEIIAVNVEMKINDVVCLARDENYSRMPVYQENIDNIIGILNAKDLLGLVGCRDITGFHVRHFMREALFVPETAKCDDVLSEMLRKKVQMAIVVDEYGGTEGLVCMEDILEEIVGNIQDEYDDEEVGLCRVTDSIYTMNGNADPDEILPELGLEVPEDMELDTMSGFVVELLGRIPETTERPSVDWRGVRFSVLLVEDNWIEKIKAEILQPAQEETKG